MTGVDPATITERRARIVADLSAELGLPPEDVAAALSSIADSAAEEVAAEAGAQAKPPQGAVPQAEIEPASHEAEPLREPEPARTEGRRRRGPALWLTAALLGIGVVAIIVISATASPRPAARPRTLDPLPGGIAGSTGSITVTAGSAGTRRLLVQVSGLPAAGSGHYEVWLYNSIIDSVPLGRLAPNGKGSFTLPAVVKRFASIDISRQPPGMIEPSGVSVLRAADPLTGAPH